ncbi:NAD(P)/FAD-dependent oxidoreductase [Pandoraea sp. NPDC090278]|uniref:NAD(P)/FAD-dependent oxidoreductase n=1 Tax=Pandoraea sp. NPDC090278 TaxID=3364391 RepID=UPI00383B5E9E
MKRILIVGGGFAGLWSALGAARKLDEAQATSDVEVVLVNPTAHHSIRVRNYEDDLDATLVPLVDVLEPAGVRWIRGSATHIDAAARTVTIDTDGKATSVAYDKLVLASGSHLAYAPVEGLAVHAFDVDTYEGARRLEQHLATVVREDGAGKRTVIVIGAGLTGVELAAELPSRLRALVAAQGGHADQQASRVILVDRTSLIASAMGGAQPVIEQAMTEMGVEMMPGVDIKRVDSTGITLADGTHIEAATVVWCGGMRASPLAECFPVERDALGRLPVDKNMQVDGVANVFAAGDVARALFEDGKHASVMSCQHGRPMGRFAGHNVAADLLGLPMLPLDIDWYTTIVDLGPWGAVYTEGWDRKLAAQGQLAKKVKQVINCERIYPPRTGVRADLFKAAEPSVQAPPPIGKQTSVDASAEG